MNFAKSFLIVPLLGLALAGCGGDGDNPGPITPTVTLTANPTTIRAGESTTITWQTTNAASVSANFTINQVRLSGGTSVVRPTETTTYYMTATPADSSGRFPRGEVTVTVEPAGS